VDDESAALETTEEAQDTAQVRLAVLKALGDNTRYAIYLEDGEAHLGGVLCLFGRFQGRRLVIHNLAYYRPRR